MTQITVDELKELLRYDPATGHFVWLKRDKKTPYLLNKRAGTLLPIGYVQIKVGGKKRMAHRLAWLYVHGKWPSAEIDHINGDKSDNRIDNLRACSREQNGRNQKRPKNNSSGYKGVSRGYAKRSPWLARIMIDGVSVSLGNHKTPEDAARAYDKAALKHHGDFACLNFPNAHRDETLRAYACRPDT